MFFTATSRLVFDQISRFHGPAMLTCKINPHTNSQGFYEPQLWIVRSCRCLWRGQLSSGASLLSSLPPLPPEFIFSSPAFAVSLLFNACLLLAPTVPEVGGGCEVRMRITQWVVNVWWKGNRPWVLQTRVNLALLWSWACEYTSLSLWSLISKMRIIIFIDTIPMMMKWFSIHMRIPLASQGLPTSLFFSFKALLILNSFRPCVPALPMKIWRPDVLRL